jgi:iron-sulfur cluster assembly protein
MINEANMTTTDPVSFTDAAVEHIQKMIAQDTQNLGFRLSVKETGCSGFSYVPKIVTAAQPTDIQFMAQSGLQVFVDPDSLPYLKNIVIDFVIDQAEGLKQKRLVFINPNEKNRCGCGESFTIE